MFIHPTDKVQCHERRNRTYANIVIYLRMYKKLHSHLCLNKTYDYIYNDVELIMFNVERRTQFDTIEYSPNKDSTIP